MDGVSDNNMALVWNKKTVIGSAENIGSKVSEEILKRIGTIQDTATNIVEQASTSNEDR